VPCSSVELRRARPLLGTRVEVAVIAADAGTAAAAAAAALERVAQIHARLSFHEPASELSLLQREASRRPVRVSRETARLLRRVLALARATGGAFDPTVAGRLVAAGHLPAPPGAPEPDPRASFRDVEVTTDGRVRFRRPLWLDLGGVAKGWAVDRALAVLRAWGVRAARVDAGGDLRVCGGAPARVGVRDPNRPGALAAVLELARGALASSAVGGDRLERAGRLVDPRAGALAEECAGATVVARTATEADALTKLVLFAPARADAVLARRGASALLLAHGRVRRLGVPLGGPA
jgi:thiamine biosynthesis lipoprotein